MVKRGILTVMGAIAAVLVVRWVALTVVDVPVDFVPLAGPGPAIFFTGVLGAAAVLVYGAVRRFAKRPEPTFRWIAVPALLVSFVPDLLLLTDGAAEQMGEATPASVGILMALHVVAAAVIVPGLTLGAPTDGHRSAEKVEG